MPLHQTNELIIRLFFPLGLSVNFQVDIFFLFNCKVLNIKLIRVETMSKYFVALALWLIIPAVGL